MRDNDLRCSKYMEVEVTSRFPKAGDCGRMAKLPLFWGTALDRCRSNQDVDEMVLYGSKEIKTSGSQRAVWK